MFQVQYHKRGRAPDLYWVNGAVGETHTIALRRALDDIIKDMDADGVPCEVTHLGDDVYQVRDGNSGESIQFDTIRETCYHLLGDDYDSIRVVQLREDDDNG